ncbi:hypothetical protein PR202_ga22085 [Eleusine coracana subsp. coracana]|uniref:RING-type domain-containing protein n=1 Tax=Eleusine coracana subsp. coracana TaxID=191504 RepID=A0AAV5D0Q2_ELECO|nr:hypothetical protein QOZ80_9AG0684210 [Eleusine coracana subsp. coracana]GJN04529.1 hypothetical protein PR202_ga22085 [Eleusine coracana subsp. coracana]
MLPGVELARRRRVHYHGDVAAGEQHHHVAHTHGHHRGGASAGGVTGPALAARIRLEEKLRGAGPPSPSRWSRLIPERDRRAISTRRNRQEQQQQQSQHEEQEILSTSTEPNSVVTLAVASTSRAELRRTLSKVDLCAVCLDEVRERHQRVTRLPCSHKYHSECVLPWLAIQPDCPCCRTLVPQVHTLS